MKKKTSAQPGVIEPPLDLVVLVADADAEWGIRTLIEKRYRDLGIRPIRAEVLRHPYHDPAVFQEAQEFLRPYLSSASYAVVLLDREGSGQEQKSAKEIERDLEARLHRNGWAAEGNPRAIAVTIDPELEVWICWSEHETLGNVLCIPREMVQAVLKEVPVTPNGKPQRPKETLEKLLRQGQRPHSPRIYQELAERAEIRSGERSFDKLLTTLRTWFPPDS